jgi:hypothetical protein
MSVQCILIANASPSAVCADARLRAAFPLHTMPVSAQHHYKAIDAEGHGRTSAKPLKSTSLQHQPNVRAVADAPGSKAGALLEPVGARHTHAGRTDLGEGWHLPYELFSFQRSAPRATAPAPFAGLLQTGTRVRLRAFKGSISLRFKKQARPERSRAADGHARVDSALQWAGDRRDG